MAPCRLNIFMFDQEDDEVHFFADSLNGTLLSGGLDSRLWVAGGQRMPGRDVTLAIARDCPETERPAVNAIAWKIGEALFSEGVIPAHLEGGFSTTDGPCLVGGWSPKRWDPGDVGKLRIQIRKKDLVSQPF